MLYRIDRTKSVPQENFMFLKSIEKAGLLVPVEPCEHGNYDRHQVEGGEWATPSYFWCEGAALKEGT